MGRGAALMIVAMLLTPAADATARTLAETLGPATTACARSAAAGLIALALAGATGRRIRVPAGDRLGLALRTGLLAAATTALLAALARAPLAEAAGGFLIAPVVSGLLGLACCGERPTPARLAGTGLGLAGAVLLVRPEAGLGGGTLLALAGGALLGAYLAATRAARDPADALSTLAVQSLAAAVLLAPFALAGGLPAPTPGLAAGTLALGALAAACHGLTVAAYRRAEAMALAPLHYVSLPAAAVVGLVWFGEIPDPSALCALAAIGAGGVLALLPGRPAGGPRVA